MNNKAFTLIEILAVISIIILLSGIVLVNYRVGERQFTLQRAAGKLASDIRRAQEMAMSAEELPGGGVPGGGYGVYFEKNTDNYKLYADVSPPDFRYDAGDQVIETIYLEKGVEISLVFPAKTSINFTPPDPTVNLKDSAGLDSDNVEITIALIADPSKTRTILVNKVGRIDID